MIYYLKDQKCANYWFESGTPYFLIELLKKNPNVLENIENKAVSASTLGAFDVEKIPLITLLYQIGYLTIKSYERISERYILGFPNERYAAAVFKKMLL